jgi:tRNA1Val (adenine37-N6)-methyltransferase
MSNQWFKCKQFEIKQDKCGQKVGTDSFLLGAWVNPENATTILDIGIGTGILSLMCAQRSQAKIYGIEIDKDAYEQAVQNANASPWANRIEFFHKSLEQYKTSKIKFDVIISNPPYFDNSLISPDDKRTLARHSHSLSLADMVEFSNHHLTKSGRLALILPIGHLNHFESLLKAKNWFVYRVTKVFPKPDKEAHRILIECGKEKKDVIYDELTIETNKRHVYTPEFYTLTHDFYLDLK